VTTVKTRKKLIEVALPLEAINVASAAEKQPGIGAHPRGLHLYWARRPLATARAVIFAQMVDDPSANPELFPTEQKQDKERQRLFRIIENLVKWENTTNEALLQAAREEIWQSWRRACADNADHPQAKEVFNRHVLPGFHDPFAGGGAIPLEAQRLGLESYATDLNPVAVMINKAMIEIPPKFAGKSPVNPEARGKRDLVDAELKGAQGLAEDVRYYGEWMRAEAEKRIGSLYPKVNVTAEMVRERPDLAGYLDQELTVIAWIWARTVKSPNPACAQVDVPLASTFMLSTKPGKEAYVRPVVENGGYRFVVKNGKPKDSDAANDGTKLPGVGANFWCLMSKSPIEAGYIRNEAKSGRMSACLMAIVAEGSRGRVYLSPTLAQQTVALRAMPSWKPDTEFFQKALGFRVGNYGMSKWGDLFTERQLVALNTFADLIAEARDMIVADALIAGFSKDEKPLREGGIGVIAYAEAVGVYLSFAINRLADYNSSIATWKPSGEQVMQTFKRQALPMTWDFPESNVLGHSAICWSNCVKYAAANLVATAGLGANRPGFSTQHNASTQSVSLHKVISTDPPYYDNIGYADLSDFFYVWMGRSLKHSYPDLFATLAVPKTEELVATPARHGGVKEAEDFFLNGMTLAMGRIASFSHPAYPVTIYYAFKQSEGDSDGGVASTGWETFLDAVIRAGFATCGTWPMRTELANRMRGIGSNALASCIVIVCRARSINAPSATRRDFVAALQQELPGALQHLKASNIAPVDMAQSAIGPGMAIYTRYARIVEADGKQLTVRDALKLINQVLDEHLAEQEGNWDADTRWGVTWFEQNAFAAGEFGLADQLARAKNTSVAGVVQAGFVSSNAGKVRILKPEELPADWDPATDARLTVWEMLHHLVRAYRSGEAPAATLLAKMGDKADSAKELAYRLYGICEKKKRSAEGQLYNDLITVWPDLLNQSKQTPAPTTRPGEFELDA
jgi:putative DNA methylase